MIRVIENQQNHPVSAERKQPAIKQSVVRGLAKLALAASAITAPLVGELMFLTKEGNPVSAIEVGFERMKSDSEKDKIFCPPAPKPDELARLKEEFSNVVSSPDLEAAQKKAEARGLHFAAVDKVAESIATAKSPETATKELSSHFKLNYGFELKLTVPKKLLENEQAFGTYKAGLRNFAAITSALPSELLQAANLSGLEIRDFDDAEEIIGDYSSGTRAIRMDYENIATPRVFIHELMHALHYKSCDGKSSKDPAITDQNPQDFVYTGDIKKAQQLDVAQYLGTVSYAYGATNLFEDVATIGETFMIGNADGTNAVFDVSNPTSGKLSVVMERIDKLAPGAAQYLKETRGYFNHLQYNDAQSNNNANVAPLLITRSSNN